MKTSLKPIALTGVNAAAVTAISQEWKEPSWVLDLRLQALQNYESAPWPDEKDDKWKRTGLDKLSWKDLSLHPVFSAGASLELSQESRDRGVIWYSLEKAFEPEAERVRQAWQSAIDRAHGNKFLSLTLSLANAGGCLIVPRGVTVKAPLTLPLQWSELAGAKFPLNFIFVEEAGEANVWEELEPNASANPASTTTTFISSYSIVELKENAKGSCTYLQHWDDHTWHFQFQDVVQGAFSKFNAVAVSIGGHVFHNEATLHLKGQGAENKVLGVNFGDGEQNFENWVTQNHTAIKTTSDIQYRGALKGSAHSFFSGLVSITKEAQQSDAYQAAKSLLLSNEARADAVPNLEILADDVKCSHGAAVGPVDEDQKFYLQTRGIPPAEAEEIIVQGFVEPVIAEVPSIPAQEKLRAFIEEKLRKQ